MGERVKWESSLVVLSLDQNDLAWTPNCRSDMTPDIIVNRLGFVKCVGAPAFDLDAR